MDVAGIVSGLFAGLIIAFFSFISGAGVGFEDGYKEGQLDYQRGDVKYELTETGYIEIFEESE